MILTRDEKLTVPTIDELHIYQKTMIKHVIIYIYIAENHEGTSYIHVFIFT
jgi:hypothetical protein